MKGAHRPLRGQGIVCSGHGSGATLCCTLRAEAGEGAWSTLGCHRGRETGGTGLVGPAESRRNVDGVFQGGGTAPTGSPKFGPGRYPGCGDLEVREGGAASISFPAASPD